MRAAHAVRLHTVIQGKDRAPPRPETMFGQGDRKRCGVIIAIRPALRRFVGQVQRIAAAVPFTEMTKPRRLIRPDIGYANTGRIGRDRRTAGGREGPDVFAHWDQKVPASDRSEMADLAVVHLGFQPWRQRQSIHRDALNLENTDLVLFATPHVRRRSMWSTTSCTAQRCILRFSIVWCAGAATTGEYYLARWWAGAVSSGSRATGCYISPLGLSPDRETTSVAGRPVQNSPRPWTLQGRASGNRRRCAEARSPAF
jgi:hypothetical protein